MLQRLFVGIELPDSVRRTLADIRMDYPTARWHPPGALHVTLSFIGSVDQATAQQMAAALEGLPDPGGQLAINGVGYFGSEERPKVLWAGVDASMALLQLQQVVEQRLLPLGLVADTRPYRPHVTLARVRQGGAVLQGFLQQYAALRLPAFAVSQVCLYVSRGGSGPVQYEVIQRFTLG